MSDKKKKVWSDDVPWSVRDSNAQKAKEKGSRDKQSIKDSPRYYIPILQIIKRLFGRGD